MALKTNMVRVCVGSERRRTSIKLPETYIAALEHLARDRGLTTREMCEQLLENPVEAGLTRTDTLRAGFVENSGCNVCRIGRK